MAKQRITAPAQDEHGPATNADVSISWDDSDLGWEMSEQENPADIEPEEYEPVQEAPAPAPTLADAVLLSLRRCMASINTMTPETASNLLQRIQASPRVLEKLSANVRKTYTGVFEVLTYECTVSSGRRIDLTTLPVITVYAPSVRKEIDQIIAISPDQIPADPHATWFALVEMVQRHQTRKAALELADQIAAGAPLADLIPAHAAVEPPTTQKKAIRTGKVRNAAELASDIRSEMAGRHEYRFSSGLPTLDVGYTGTNEARGFIAPGQFSIVMGPTGTGKSSFSYAITPAFGLDLQHWGLKDAYQVFFHTEEESLDKLKGFRMDVGQKFHQLAKNLLIENVGTSRQRMAELLYDLVIAADNRARSTRRPITEFLPYIVQLDYLQSIRDMGEEETPASANTAEFLLRGVAAWNPEEMAKFSGVDFRSYAGMAWPQGMENHRVAVLAYAQLVKVEGQAQFYQAGKRGVQKSDFVLLDGQDEPRWDLREGDLRIFTKSQMRGSGVVANNAHSIVILHRSVPGASKVVSSDGKVTLDDTRARILFDKSRAGASIPYAPMRFNAQTNGFRAQYFDEVAERAIAAGKLKDFHPSYSEVGDPILPVRPKISRLGTTKY